MNNKLQPTTDNGQRTTDRSNWRLYAAAGTAALAASSAADAAIIYVGSGCTAQVNTDIAFNFGTANTAHFNAISGGPTVRIDHTHFRSGRTAVATLKSGHGVISFGANGYGEPLRFASGKPIAFTHSAGAGRLAHTIGSVFHGNQIEGNFPHNKTGFVGFKFQKSGSVVIANGGSSSTTFKDYAFKKGDLGWLRVELQDYNGDGYADSVQIIDMAYNDAGGPINAGQETGPVPEPSALGLLAMGSAGVLAWRRRRTATPAGH